MKQFVNAGILALLLTVPVASAVAAELGGSPASMARQHAVAVQENYAFLRTPADVQRLELDGELVLVTSGTNHILSGVSFPYARAEVKAFLDRFAADYRDSTGAQLVVTSLTRPAALQPRNAHKLSVHPAGMAVDLRVPATAAEREFLERSLLALERDGILDVTRERTPAHYHIAVFAGPFGTWAAMRDSTDAANSSRAALLAAARSAMTRSGAAVREVASSAVASSSSVLAFAVVMAVLAALSLLVLGRPAPAVARRRTR